MRLLVVGHGRMGQLVEKLAPEHGCEVAAIAEMHTPIPVALEAAGPVDVAIDFSQPDAVPKNLAALAARHINVVIGTTGWQEQETALRGLVDRCRHRRARVGELLDRHEHLPVPRRGGARTFVTTDVGAWIHEAHHAAKKDAPSGTARLLFDAMRLAGYSAIDRRLVHARRAHSRHARRRVRRPVGDRHADAHRARPRRVRARRARGREMAQRPARLVQHA